MEGTEPLSNKQHTLRAISLIVLGLAACIMVFSYMDAFAPAVTQTASAAAAPTAYDDLSIAAKSAIVVELNTGRVLFEKNADAQLPLASLTKVPLALVVSEVLPASRVLEIPYNTAFTEGAKRLLKGEKLTVRDVMHFSLVASSNESSQILAEYADAELRLLYASSTPGEAALSRMNDLARSLGLTRTYFRNVSGLDIDETESGAYGSARDMARLFAYAATARPELFDGTTRDGLLLIDAGGQTTTAFNTNQALGSIPGLIMGKTGFTDLAGGNLAIVFDVGLSQPVVAVVLGSTIDGRFSDMRSLVDRTLKAISEE
jgi:serine-type D-Ala-D-Ala carboxypeptidase (penicillin-binding protein 5/6)